MNLHWILSAILLVAAFITNHYWTLDDESKPLAYSFYILLFLTWAASGSYLLRFVQKLPEWNIWMLLGTIVNALIFAIASWTYWLMWRSRRKN